MIEMTQQSIPNQHFIYFFDPSITSLKDPLYWMLCFKNLYDFFTVINRPMVTNWLLSKAAVQEKLK